MFTLTVNNSWFDGDEYGKFAKAHKQGFKAMEILNWSSLDLERIRNESDRTGVAVSAILVRAGDPVQQALIANTHGIVHADARDAFVSAVKESLAAAAVIGTRNIVVTTGNETEDVSRKVQHDNVVQALRAAAPLAEAAGIQLVLEPLNILVDHMGYFLTTTAESVEIIHEVGSPMVKLLYDVYHQQITEGNLINNIRNNIKDIGHIHVGDVPGRKQPGTGEINYKNVFKAIRDTGFEGFVVFECGLTEPVEVVCPKMWALLES